MLKRKHGFVSDNDAYTYSDNYSLIVVYDVTHNFTSAVDYRVKVFGSLRFIENKLQKIMRDLEVDNISIEIEESNRDLINRFEGYESVNNAYVVRRK